MDAIIRNIDPARLERERRAEHEFGLAHAVEVAADDIGLTDTVVFQHPVIPLSDERRERERILDPALSGSLGGAFKMLRTQVMRRLAAINANTLAVLSASSGEGKTLTAINLAIAI